MAELKGTLSLDELMNMNSQAVGFNKDLIKEFDKVRKKLLKKGFNNLVFEDTKDRKSRLWFEDRKLVAYDTKKDEALVRFGNGNELWAKSWLLNINRLVVIKSIAEYVLKIA